MTRDTTFNRRHLFRERMEHHVLEAHQVRAWASGCRMCGVGVGVGTDVGINVDVEVLMDVGTKGHRIRTWGVKVSERIATWIVVEPVHVCKVGCEFPHPHRAI